MIFDKPLLLFLRVYDVDQWLCILGGLRVILLDNPVGCKSGHRTGDVWCSKEDGLSHLAASCEQRTKLIPGVR
jgi:hypothetical protein